MTTSNARKGRFGETQAIRALENAGYTILARNWRCPIGEIDIVAKHNGEIVIVEVRSRVGGIDSALESVGRGKQRRLTQLAQAYLAATDMESMPHRVDVVAVDYRTGQVEIIENAAGW